MTPPVMGVRAALVLLAGLGGLAALTGCAGVQDDEVRRVATTFYEAHAADDPATACDTLAPRTRSALEQSAGRPCDEALAEEDVPALTDPTEVRVFGTQAEVTWRGETTFLARFQGGWKVSAAACTPRPDLPYDCAISGG
jgi:hypothetical protein